MSSAYKPNKGSDMLCRRHFLHLLFYQNLSRAILSMITAGTKILPTSENKVDLAFSLKSRGLQCTYL